MNIEKAREKKGFIIEDEEDTIPERAPSVESGNKMPMKLKEKLLYIKCVFYIVFGKGRMI